MRKGLNIGASSVGGIVTNNGILSLGAGTLSKDVNSKNGTVNVIGDVSATSNVETKTFSVADGASYATTDQASLSISTSADLKGTLEASGTSTVTLNEGVALSFGFNGKFILTGGSVVLDSKNLIKSDYSSNFGKNVEGGSGTLALRLEGGSEASPREYTEEEYNKTKEALFGDDVAIAEAKLTFIYGTIKLKEGQTIVIGGKTETSSDRIVIDGNTPVLANNSETVKDANINLVYEPNKFVRVVDETQTVDKPTLKASKIEIQNTAFVVKGLEVAEATESVSVTLTENATITLTGGDDADKSVVAKNGEQAEVVTDFVVKDQSTLNFGLANNSNNQKASVKSVIVEKGGTHNVAGNGLEKTNFSYESLSIGEAGTSENAANVSVTNAQLKVNKLAANSGIIYVDPAYLEAAELSGDTFGAALLVSSGSIVNIGTEIAEIKKALEKAGINPTVISEGLTLDSNQSMLAINGNVNLGTTGQIVVDAKVDDTGKIGGLTVSDAVHFGDGSLLAVNGAQIQTKAAITAAGGAKAFIGDTAKLYIANAQAGGKYFILDVDGDIAGSKKGWTGDNLLTDSDIVGAIFHYVEEDGNEKGWVSVTSKPANEAYPNLDGELVKLVNNLYGNGINDVYSDTAGVRFLSRATNKAFLGADSKAGTQAIESAARIAMAGAVPQMTLMASETLSEAMGNRMNIANGYNTTILEQEFKTGLALWITPLWKNQSGWGMEGCNFNYGFNANIGGVALGADYSFSESVKAGVAFNIGGGYSKSSGDFSSTANHMNFWGVGVYGGYNDGRLSVLGDASYTSTYNKLEQDLDARMLMKNLKADVRASVWSLGIRGDYKFTFDALDITPHVGVRFQSISSQEYDIKGGCTVAKSDGIQQSLWSIPVGVTFGKDFKTASGWSVTPSVDFTVTPRFGDLKTYERIRFTGVPGDASLHTQTRDYVTYKGTAGIGAKYNNIGLNLNYSYEAGSCTSGHGVNASFRWEF